VDWLAHDLPVERQDEDPVTAGRLLRADVVTCGLADPAGEVGARIAESPYGFALVTSSSGVLLGRLRASALGVPEQTSAEEVMEAGPSTVRPDISAEKLAQRLRRKGFKTAVVTTPEGQLLGVVRCTDLERGSCE
jgi:Mg/Co/Ni transporter MgtE